MSLEGKDRYFGGKPSRYSWSVSGRFTTTVSKDPKPHPNRCPVVDSELDYIQLTFKVTTDPWLLTRSRVDNPKYLKIFERLKLLIYLKTLDTYLHLVHNSWSKEGLMDLWMNTLSHTKKTLCPHPPSRDPPLTPVLSKTLNGVSWVKYSFPRPWVSGWTL